MTFASSWSNRTNSLAFSAVSPSRTRPACLSAGNSIEVTLIRAPSVPTSLEDSPKSERVFVSSGFFFIYAQVYNVIPLYLKKVVELDPAVDLITMANPFVIVFFQLLITKKFGKLKPINSIIVGIVIIGLAMIINLAPIFMSGGVSKMVLGDFIPIGSLFAVLTVGLIAFGELFTSARTYEYIITLRAVTSIDAMTADWAKIPSSILEKISNRIINEVNGVNRVLFDITQKPPGTIEYE